MIPFFRITRFYINHKSMKGDYQNDWSMKEIFLVLLYIITIVLLMFQFFEVGNEQHKINIIADKRLKYVHVFIILINKSFC